jgi:glycosyltransferase involved in cell wall biosynthesis
MVKNKRILFIITRLTIGGVAAHLIQTAKYLEDNGYECLIMTGSIEKKDKEMLRFQTDYTIVPLYLKEMARPINPFKDLIAIIHLVRIIRHLKPDIVHTHTVKAGLIGRIASWICGVPKIYHTYHGLNFQGYFGWFFTKVSITIEKVLSKISTKLISLSPLLTIELLKHKICRQGQIVTIPLGFNFVKPYPGKSLRKLFGISDEKIIVANIGRLAKIKNHDLFIEIAESVAKFNSNVHFLIIGDGERREELQSLIDSKGLQQLITITGFFDDLNEYYHEINITLLTSVNEGTPVTILEAFFFNVLVVSTNVGGVPDLVTDAYNGFLFNINDKDSFVKLILDYAAHQEKYQIILDNANDFVKEKFSLKSTCDQLLTMYEA